jgi:hypothetical protein
MIATNLQLPSVFPVLISANPATKYGRTARSGYHPNTRKSGACWGPRCCATLTKAHRGVSRANLPLLIEIANRRSLAAFAAGPGGELARDGKVISGRMPGTK